MGMSQQMVVNVLLLKTGVAKTVRKTVRQRERFVDLILGRTGSFLVPKFVDGNFFVRLSGVGVGHFRRIFVE
jgi:hypothetical protein